VTRFILLISCLSTTALAGSVGSYSGCKSLKGERAACEKCVGGGNFYQPGSGCGLAPGMHKSKAVAVEKPPPRPTAMAKTGTQYATIAAGTFDIGARPEDEPKQEGKEVFDSKVTITRPFKMKTTEVTQGEFYFVVGRLTWSYDKACGLDCPASFTWSEAILYLNALSKKEGLEPCYEVKNGLAKWTKGLDCTGYRLPTEAEWEWAARGGSEEPRYGELNDIAWYSDNANGTIHPVGKKQKNAYGLYDVLGNAAEWAWDAEDFKPFVGDMTDPIIGGLELESDGQNRIVRGGSYRDGASDVRVQFRFQLIANAGGAEYSIRPVRTVK
jgi:formylglycine-generating enzyme required for sulfatase activity